MYHKPAETFVGRGRIGADSLARKAGECVPLPILSHFHFTHSPARSLNDDRQTARLALQTVVHGQQAENLLNFDDDPALDSSLSSSQPTGIAATAALASVAEKSLLAGTSSNPLDDLVSIFGSAGITSAAPATSAGGGGGAGAGAAGGDPFGGLSFGTPLAPTTPAAPSVVASPPPQQQQQGAQEDLLGLF